MKLGLRVALSLHILVLTACGQNVEHTVPVYELVETDFSIKVKGFGEIEAVESQIILTPGRRPMIIAWLKDENSHVEKGDIIARFDAQQIIKDSREEELDLLSLRQDILRSAAQQKQIVKDIDSDQIYVKQEFDFVDKFSIDDLRIYSQLEIIDTLANRDFLQAKDNFLSWKEESVDEQHTSEIAVLDIRRDAMQTKLEQHQLALSSLEVVSPYTGLLIYQKDRRGEKPSIGQTVFPSRPLAHVPNLDRMQATLFVQANEAIELSKGLVLSIRLDAFPDTTFKGEITEVSGFPRSIERGNPVSYFEVSATLLEQDKSMMQPGRKLTAEINVTNPTKRLVVPLQSLYFEDNSSFVYLQTGTQFTKRRVSSGRKNLHLVEIIDGLRSGDVIALSRPGRQDEKVSK